MPRRDFKNSRKPSEFDQRIVDLARVTRVMAGGKRLRFRATVVLGDKKGKVGWAVAKAADVAEAVNKGANKAKKNMIKVPMVKETIAHQVTVKYKSAKVMLKPAKKGVGVIAGGAVRTVLELAGVPNVYAKMIGRTNNKINNVAATFKAFEELAKVEVEEEEEMETGKSQMVEGEEKVEEKVEKKESKSTKTSKSNK